MKLFKKEQKELARRRVKALVKKHRGSKAKAAKEMGCSRQRVYQILGGE